MLELITEKWDDILRFMKEEYELQEVSFKMWLSPLKPVKADKKKLYIIASDDPKIVKIVTKKYKTLLAVAISEVAGIEAEPVFITSNEEIPDENDPLTEDPVRKANLNPKYTFESFVSGKSNQLAHAAALAVAEDPGEDYKILYIYGGVGLGKTHLMQAIAHYILKRNPRTNILYISSETFLNDYIASLKPKDQSMTPDSFREKYRRKPDVLLIDDIQFIAGKTETQEEFFHTFNELYLNNKQIVITSDKPPKDINNLEERIRSRFEGGLVVDIQVPDYETRLAILKKKEEEEGYNIDDEVIEYIAENIESNIRILEGALKKIILGSKLTNDPINVETAKEVLKDIIGEKNGPAEVTPQKIINVVCDHFKVDEKELLSKKRNKDISFPRQIAIYLICENIDISQEAIGSLLGGRDHSTIVYGRDKISKELKTDPQLKNTVDILNKKIKC